MIIVLVAFCDKEEEEEEGEKGWSFSEGINPDQQGGRRTEERRGRERREGEEEGGEEEIGWVEKEKEEN